ncbi:MAG: flavodoxin family protein [Firmicutes bacterium]|nr:flavodoxin family protein [Bacillota bacterium]
MKVVAFNGSPRHHGNTVILIQRVLEKIAQQGIKTELIHLTGQPLRGCIACYQCRERKNQKCAIDFDPLNEWLPKMFAADGIIIGSPTYFANLTAEAKAFIDRSGYVSRGNGNLLKRKVGAAVVAVRRAGAINVFNAINDFFLINEMIVPGSSYWNLALGREIGEVESDAEGLKTMDILGENIAWLLKRLN